MAGIDLILLLKFTLYMACKDRTEEEDEDQILDLAGGNYNGESSFCTDNMMRIPLQERIPESSERILHNGATENGILVSHLSTIKEATNSEINSSSLQSNTFSEYKNKSKSFGVVKKKDVAKFILNIDSDNLNTYEGRPKSEMRKSCSLILTIAETPAELQHENSDGAQNDDSNHNEKVVTNKSKHTVFSTGDHLHSAKNANHNSSGFGNIAKTKSLTLNQPRYLLNQNLNHSYSCYSHNSVSHARSYCDFTSFASNVSRNTIIPSDHMLDDDIIANSVVTVVAGVILAVLTIPSIYTEAKALFLSPSPIDRPDFHVVQLSILFESLVKFNAVYKFFLYVVSLGSFRQASLILLNVWIPNKLARSCKKRAFPQNSNFGDIESANGVITATDNILGRSRPDNHDFVFV